MKLSYIKAACSRLHRQARSVLNFLRTDLITIFLVLAAASFFGCRDINEKNNAPAGLANTPILLFNGTGTSPNDVLAVETVLYNNNLNYSTVNSSRLNAMSEAQIRAYRLLIIPGGNFIEIGKSLTSATAANIRGAVQNGMNYFGICAGAFLAGNSAFNGLNLTNGVRFGFYAAENQGVRKAAVPIATVSAPTVDYYWEDGPQLTGWGEVIGKYPDGTPAMVQGAFGKGWIVLTGVHPEAPESWRRSLNFNTPANANNAYAGVLILAALNRTALPHY